MSTVLFGKTMDNPCSPAPITGANCPGVGAPRPHAGYPLLPCETGNAADEDGDGAVNDGCLKQGSISEADIAGACDNNISDDYEDSDVNDGCAVVGDQSEGERIPGACSNADEGGCEFLRNPTQASALTFTTFATSGRDADGDTIENSLDVCATAPNPDWDPRASDRVNDTDGDGFPNACDPNPTVPGAFSPSTCLSGYTGSDEDQDCYANRADNCPNQNERDENGKPRQSDMDGDGIGDACDGSPTAPDGPLISLCLKFPLEVGDASSRVVGAVDGTPGPGCIALALTAPTAAPVGNAT